MKKSRVLLIVLLLLVVIGIVLLVLLRGRRDGQGAVGGQTSERTGKQGALEFDVKTMMPWHDAGMRVAAGQRLKLVATGEYAFRMEGNTCGPEGKPEAQPYSGKWPANDLTGLALIGRIGEEGAPFLVGKEAEITADRDGELQFMVNDDILNENDGVLHVRVTVCGANGR